jgi:hypothetical protein
VYDATLGNRVLTMNPGPEVSAGIGWDWLLWYIVV